MLSETGVVPPEIIEELSKLASDLDELDLGSCG